MRLHCIPVRAAGRRALARAGIVNGHTHRCRRKGCGHSERHPYAERGRCPKCRVRL